VDRYKTTAESIESNLQGVIDIIVRIEIINYPNLSARSNNTMETLKAVREK